MRATMRSTTKSGEGGGGTDDDDGPVATRSPIARRSSHISSWLLIGLLATVLLVHHSSAAALDRATDLLGGPDARINGANGSEVAAADEITWRNETIRERQPEFVDLTPVRTYSSSNSYEVELNDRIPGRPTLLLRRSDQTKDDYKKFVDKNCIEHSDLDKERITFLSWERDQFAFALKSSILGSPTRKDRTPEEREEHVAEWMRLQAILPVVNQTMLESQCKPMRGVYDEDRILQLTANDILENEIVNSVFANMYKRGLFYADSFRPVYRERKKGLSTTLAPEDDQAFTKEVLRTLKR